MEELPRRNRIQIHLSTAVILMFFAGILVWANTQERILTDEKNESEALKHLFFIKPNRFGIPATDFHRINYYAYGWPATSVIWSKDIGLESHQLKELARGYHFKYGMIAFDLVIALLILFFVWSVCEWRIRCRK